jgi:hypothetical protein
MLTAAWQGGCSEVLCIENHDGGTFMVAISVRLVKPRNRMKDRDAKHIRPEPPLTNQPPIREGDGRFAQGGERNQPTYYPPETVQRPGTSPIQQPPTSEPPTSHPQE